MTISLIVAHDENYAIGLDNELLWHIPEDLRFFKDITTNKCIVMGKNTYSSIGRPLPNRLNFVVSRNNIITNEEINNVFWFEDFTKQKIKVLEKVYGEIFIIGGANIYKQALEMNIVDYIYATEVEGKHTADTFIPFYKDIYTEKTSIKPKRKSISGKIYEINLYSKGE